LIVKNLGIGLYTGYCDYFIMTKLIAVASILFLVLMSFGLVSAIPLISVSRNASAGTDISFTGATNSWSNPGNIQTSNDVYAKATLDSSAEITDYLRANNFGFNINSSATIRGIEVRVERHQNCTSGSCTSNVSDNRVRMLKNWAAVTTDRSSTAIWPSADEVITYGDSTDLWGTTWTVGDINNISTGFVLSVKHTAGGEKSIYVDQISMTVYYTLPDTTAPVLNLPSDITAEATSSSGAIVSYVANATDDTDGAIAANCAPVSGSNFSIGNTTVTCSATDSSGNTATGSFTITVQDTTGPSIIGTPLDMIINATDSSGATVTYTDPTANDLVDGSAIVSCNPTSGSTFPFGTTTVTCSANDSTGNTDSTSFTVTVSDTTAPVITLLGTDPISIEVGSVYVDAGANASDDIDGDLTSNITTVNPVDTSVLGTYTVTYDVTDSNGNSATQMTRTVNVVDTTAPIITLIGGNVQLTVGDAYADDGATAEDNYDGNLTANVSVINNVDSSVAGVYIVEYYVSDSSGNSANINRTVEVVNPPAPVAAGGGGGGSCTSQWNCSAWSACVAGTQTRTCKLINSYCFAAAKPAETQVCTIPVATGGNENNAPAGGENNTIPAANNPTTPGGLSGITGAVIGTLGTGGSIFVIIFILLAGGSALYLTIRRKRRLNFN
jgi:hypothetical protein